MSTHNGCENGWTQEAQPEKEEVTTIVLSDSSTEGGETLCIRCATSMPRHMMEDVRMNKTLAASLARVTKYVVPPGDDSSKSMLCHICVIAINVCEEDQHNTAKKYKYWRSRNARLSISTSATAADRVDQKERSLSSSASGTNDVISPISQSGVISPPLLSPLFWTSREMVDTECGGAFEKVQAKHRVQEQSLVCPYCNKSYQREAYLRKHIRKLHSAALRNTSAARLKRSKSTSDLASKRRKLDCEASNITLCTGCGKECAPNEVFHALTCKKLQNQSGSTAESGVEVSQTERPARRMTRSMSRAVLIPDDDSESAFSLPTCVMGPYASKKARNSRRPSVANRCDTVPRSFICSVSSCSLYFPTLAQCVMHEHEDHRMMLTFQCRDCSDWFTSKNRLNQHTKHNHIQRRICVICGQHFSYRFELEEHLRYHEYGSLYECLICRRQLPNAHSLVQHRLDIHKHNRPPPRIRILDRREYPPEPSDLYTSAVHIPFAAAERVNTNPRHVERLPRAIGTPMVARHIRKRIALMRGLRKPSCNPWNRCLATDWEPNEWRNGRPVVTSKQFVGWTNDDDLGDYKSEADVWWRRPIPQSTSELNECEPSPNLNYTEYNSARNTTLLDEGAEDYRTLSRLQRRLHKRRMIVMFIEPGPSLPTYETVLEDIRG